MDREAVLKKIKKCMALSGSANEHEAAAALRQARALMEKFNLSAETVLASTVGESRVKARYKSRAPKWDWFLAYSAASQFDCQVIFEWAPSIGSRWVFVGEGSNPEVAGYGYGVLLRQLVRAKTDFLANKVPASMGLGRRRKLGANFALGWVSKVSMALEGYAGRPREASAPIMAYMKQRGDAGEKRFDKYKMDKDALALLAIRAGAQEGAQARLYRGVNTGDGPALLD